MVTKKRLAALPDISALKNLCKSLAMLDAIMSIKWDSRYYSFNSKWGEGEEMASMRNGSGEEYFILFNSQGALIKGFSHESPMSPWANDPEQVWPGVLDQVPVEFESFLKEPAFSMEATTFCIWRRVRAESWQVGKIKYPDDKDPDGSDELLTILDGDPKRYQKFAEGYYERPADLGSIKAIYEHRPLTPEIIKRLNPDVTIRRLKSDLDEIDYPLN